MKNYLIGIISVMATLYVAMIYCNSAIWQLAIMFGIVMMISFVTLIVKSRMIHSHIEIPITISDINKNMQIHLVFNNKFIFRMNKVKIHVAYGDFFSKKKKKVWLTAGNIAKDISKQIFTLQINSPGSYEFEIRKMRVYDSFGLFYFERRKRSSKTALVFPEIFGIPVSMGENVRNFFGDADVYDELRPGYDPSESFGVREYREGDRLQNVHWKLSAKSDELVVKENSMPKACPVILFFNSENVWKTKSSSKYQEWLASASFSLMNAGCPHFVSFLSKSHGEIIRTRVDDEESFYNAIANYMQDGSNESNQQLLEQYKEKYRSEHYLHTIEICGGPKILIDGVEINNPDIKEFQFTL